MTDVRLYQADDGGEIDFGNGEPVTGDGLDTAAYLSMFGGNERDNGLTEGDRKQWWANFEERVAVRRQRSETQALLQDTPAIPANLLRVEDAARRDLAWMETELAAKISVEATMPDVDLVNLSATIEIGKTKYPFDFTSKWGNTQ